MTTELLSPPTPDSLQVLAELLAPLTPEAFFDKYWERAPLHLSGDPEVARRRWLDTQTLMSILTNSGVSVMDVRMARDGQQLDVERYCSTAHHHDWSSTSVLDADRVLDLYDDGVTVLLESLDRYHLPTARRGRALEQCFGCTLKSNVFLTPARSNAFPLHNDTYDGLIVQLQGRKHWDLYAHPTPLPLRSQRYEPERDEMGEALMSVDLEPGDLLYVPRGVIHRAEAIGEASLHLTLIPVWTTMYDALEALLREVSHRDPTFRRGLGEVHDDEGYIAELIDRLAAPDALAGCFDRLRDQHIASRNPLISGRWQALADRERLDGNSVVRAYHESLSALRNGEPGHVRLAWLGHEERYDVALEPALRRMLSGEAVRLSSLPGLSSDSATAVRLAAGLMGAGLVRLEVAS